MNFLQFFVWGAWLITIGNYWFGTKEWSGENFGLVFMTLGISSLFMPTLMGIIADRWLNAEKLYGILHILSGIFVISLPFANTPTSFFWIMLGAMLFYMPTISLSITVAYSALKQNKYDVIKEYPPIRVFGTIGFIVAMWLTNLSGNKATMKEFDEIIGFEFLKGVHLNDSKTDLASKVDRHESIGKGKIGLDAFKLFSNYKMALFFVFSMLLGAGLQLTNMYGDTFIHDFAKIPEFANSIAVKYPAIIMSISQISETLFILAIPFFLKKFGIKKVMLMSMFAWFFRFGLFGTGSPENLGLISLFLSMIVYGMAFDFFNISGSLFVEKEVNAKIRASAQGLFMIMTNGIGAMIGAYGSGLVVQHFTGQTQLVNWQFVWFSFAGYSLIIGLLFMLIFKYKHYPETIRK